jgi:hypothetical protein
LPDSLEERLVKARSSTALWACLMEEKQSRLILIGRFSEVAEHIHDVSHSAENDDNHKNRIP